jgi:hypothetical protein
MKAIRTTALEFLFQLLPPAVLKRCMTSAMRALSKRSSHYYTYTERPKSASQLSVSPHGRTYTDVGLVVQGPLVLEDDFTLETVRLYRRQFPGVTVIVSTWNDADRGMLDNLEREGACVLTSSKPMSPGPLNINLQIASTLNGLREVSARGKTFAVKTRSDQRVYNPFFLNALNLLVDLTPPPAATGLQKRLIVSSMGTLAFRPYGIGDMFMMGLTRDLLHYWDTAPDHRDNFHGAGATVREYAAHRLAETYLLTQFLNRQGMEAPLSIGETWNVYRELFIVLDKSTLGLFWKKYTSEREDRLALYEDHVFREMSFLEWLSLPQSGPAPEGWLDEPLVPYQP